MVCCVPSCPIDRLCICLPLPVSISAHLPLRLPVHLSVSPSVRPSLRPSGCRQKAEFLAYRRRTSPLVPLPPCMYGALPLWVKRWLLFEWPLYETDWTYCGEEEGRGLGLGSGVLPPEALAASAAYSAAASPSLHTRLSVHPPVLGSEPVGAGAAGGGGSSSGAGPDSVVVNAMAPSNGAPRY